MTGKVPRGDTNRPSRAWPVRGWLALFVLLAGAYVFSIDMRASRGASITGDEPFYLLTTQSLLRDRDLNLANQYVDQSYREFFDHPDGLWTQSVPSKDGSLLSPHDPGLAFFLIPGFAAGGLLGAQTQMMLIAAATFAFAFVLAARVTGMPLGSWLVTLGIALAATPFVYSTEIYPEIPAALALVLAVLLQTREGRPGPAAALLLCLVLTAMVWLGVKYIPLALVASVPFMLKARPSGRAALVAAGVVSGGAYAWFNLTTFGGLTPYSVNTLYSGETSIGLLNSHLGLLDRVYRLWGLFVDERFGIGRWAPMLLLLPPALVSALLHSRLSRTCVWLIVVQVLIATFVAITMMGWWFPGRTLMTVLPLASVPIVLLLRDVPRWVTASAIALACYGAAVTGSLGYAGHAGEIVVAVDPFDMGGALFREMRWLFPDYRSWPALTYLVTAGWLILGAVSAGLALTWSGWRYSSVFSRPFMRRSKRRSSPGTSFGLTTGAT